MPRILAEWEARHPAATRTVIDGLMVCYYLGLIVTGILGIAGHPSPAVSNVLGQDLGTLVWSVGTVIMAALAIAGRLRRSTDTETIALATLAVLTLLHGSMLILGSEGARGVQTGVRLLAAPLMMLAVAHEMRRPTVCVPREDRP